MESTKKMKDQAEGQNSQSETTSKTPKQGNQTSQENQGTLGNLSAKGTEVMEQAKEVATDVYNRASKTVNKGVNQAMDYGRENPGTTTLIAFGAGIGVGLLLAGSFTGSSRSRTGRIVPPVMNALTEIATEIFRR